MIDIAKHANKIPEEQDQYESKVVFFDSQKELVLKGSMRLYRIK